MSKKSEFLNDCQLHLILLDLNLCSLLILVNIIKCYNHKQDSTPYASEMVIVAVPRRRPMAGSIHSLNGSMTGSSLTQRSMAGSSSVQRSKAENCN